MSGTSLCPDFATLDIPIDVWSAPFWEATAEHRLVMPKCRACGTFRWPAGPFCPTCRTQPVDWVFAGQARIYSFAILPVTSEGGEAPTRFRIPTLVEFDEAPGVRLISVLVDARKDAVAIGKAVDVLWRSAANATVPVFTLG